MMSRLRGGRPFLALLLVGFLGRLGYEMLRSPVSPLFAQHLGAPVAIIGLIVASATISGIFVKLPSGALADVVGYKRLIVAGSVVKATGPFFYLPISVWQLLIPVRLFHGLATAIYAPAASALVASMYPKQRAERLGVYSAAENAGIVLGPAVGGLVLFYSTFNTAFLVSGAIGIVALLVAFSVPADQPKPETSSVLEPLLKRLGRGVGEIVSSPPILAASVVEATIFFGFGTLQAYLPLYALTIHFNTAQIGFLFAAQGVTSIAGRPTIGRLSDRIGRTPMIVAGVLADAAMVALIPHFNSFPILLVISAIFGLGTAAVTPSTTALIADLVRSARYGSAMGVFGSIWDTGHAAGPIISGLLLAAFGYVFAFSTVAVVMVVALAMFLLVITRYRPPVVLQEIDGPASQKV